MKDRRMAVVLLILTACTLLCGFCVKKSTEPRPIYFSEYYVVRGDTIWSIAKRVTPANVDIRKTVDIIHKVNKIDGSVIYEGATVFVPHYENSLLTLER